MASHQHLSMPYQSPHHPAAPAAMATEAYPNGTGRATELSTRPDRLERPIRPEEPFRQFTMHMRPQLETDFDPDEIPIKIQAEWDNLSPDNRKLWFDRYNGQMQEYEVAMDAWKRARRDGASGPQQLNGA